MPEAVFNQQPNACQVAFTGISRNVHGREPVVGLKHHKSFGIHAAWLCNAGQSAYQNGSPKPRPVELQQLGHELVSPHDSIHQRGPAVVIFCIHFCTLLDEVLRHLPQRFISCGKGHQRQMCRAWNRTLSWPCLAARCSGVLPPYRHMDGSTPF